MADRTATRTAMALAKAAQVEMASQAAPIFVTTEERAVYRQIKKEQEGNPKAIITRGFLRLEQVLNTRNRYAFDVVEGDGNQRASERRLKRPDAFYADAIAVVIGNRSTLAGVPAGAWEPHTWANSLVFPGATELPALITLMNTGKIRIEVDQVIYASQLDVMGSRYIDPAQQLVLSAVAGPYIADGWDRDKVWRKMTPTIRLNGGSTNVVEIFVDESINATAQTANTENVIALLAHGWYAANCADYNTARRVG